MGDRGTGMGILKLAKAIQDEIPGTYVKCITTSNSIIQDIEDTYFMPINDQLDYVCRMIHEDKNLSNGLHMIGISQGGLFVRALVQKCNLSKVGTVVSIGGPQQGIFGIPKCTIDGFIHLCLLMNELLSYGAYIKFIQSHVVQAQYWHDPLEEDVYRKYSQFLADINQENEINEIYREKMRNIQRLVLVKFSGDTIVIPKESEWFGFYQNGSSTNVTALQDSILYTEDRLGLRELNKRGDLHFIEKDGDHLHFDVNWFIEKIVTAFLK
ncbi:Palmitoyl-protein thioesterase 1 [Schistosoma haematobium]|uniref:Palmitoyl-protein thioesterase 1 n=1 Tax=Schistosoma haematobium TaxID=6185 RepID=A0A922S1J5_SCHHA|nr:Palmitoyl-protein thioesterase 1 [Schistosoma haematobium]KAH9589762.1 Palmitoyl-protein thioesterase 1 [Schistosoma haematobium]